MDINSLTEKMDSIVTQGAIVDAVKQFFAEDATTSDYNDFKTTNKAQMVEKMEGFAGAIAKVNSITKYHTLIDGNVSASEFTFDFDMKDGTKIYWHEIILRVWNDEGKVIREEYFKAN